MRKNVLFVSALLMFFVCGDVQAESACELKSRQITARDKSHVLVEMKYEGYEYAVLLTVIQDGDTFLIDSLQQEKSEYIDME